MREIKIAIETDSDIGTEAGALAFLGVLQRHPGFLPERFGTHEPLRTRFDPGRTEDFRRLWLGSAIRPDYSVGSLLFTRKTGYSYAGSVHWWRGQNRLNVISLQVRETSTAVCREALALMKDVFTALDGQYGYCCDREEFVCKNMTGWWRDPQSGRVQGGKASGYDRTRHLPGIYWANLFGPAYESFFGPGRLESAPAYSAERVGAHSWLLLSSATPWEWDTPDATRLTTGLADHLGRDAFFDQGNPEAQTRAPRFQILRSVGGYRGGVNVEPVSHEFFASPKAAKDFVDEVLERAGRLRQSVSASLDFSAASLAALDTHVQRSHRPLPEARQEALDIAAYFGEVLRRTLGGKWVIDPADSRMPAVELPDGRLEYPLVRVKKQWEDGDALLGWFQFSAAGGENLIRQ